MKKSLILAVLGLACIFAVFGQNAVELDAAITQAIREINPKIIVGPKVALLNCSSAANNLSAYVLREMAIALEKDRKLTVIPRQNIDNALKQSNLKITSEINDNTARDVGRKLNADYVVVSFFEKSGDNYHIRTRLITISAGAVQPLNVINVKDSSQVRELLGIPDPVPAPAPAATPAPVPAPAPAQAPVPATPAAGSYKIGDTGPAGGLIFYDKGNNSEGWRYLEAAPADVDGKLRATTERINGDDWKAREVGKGKANTQAIMKEAARLGGGFGWAAQACDTFTLNGYDDWYLPSKDELNYMYGNLHMKKLGNFSNDWYWSSTVVSTYGTWHSISDQNFTNGNQEDHGNGEMRRVRPVRQF